MSEANNGHKRSDEVKARIAAAHKGKPKSKAHREAIAEGMRATKANGGVPAHGSISRYRGSRKRTPCHCEECRIAWRDYKRERKAARAIADAD